MNTINRIEYNSYYCIQCSILHTFHSIEYNSIDCIHSYSLHTIIHIYYYAMIRAGAGCCPAAGMLFLEAGSRTGSEGGQVAGAGVLVPSCRTSFLNALEPPVLLSLASAVSLTAQVVRKRSGGVLAGSGLLSAALSFGLRGGGGQEQAVLFILHTIKTTICAEHKNIEKWLT